MDQSVKGKDLLPPRIILSQSDLRKKKKDPINLSLLSRKRSQRQDHRKHSDE